MENERERAGGRQGGLACAAYRIATSSCGSRLTWVVLLLLPPVLYRVNSRRLTFENDAASQLPCTLENGEPPYLWLFGARTGACVGTQLGEHAHMGSAADKANADLIWYLHSQEAHRHA